MRNERSPAIAELAWPTPPRSWEPRGCTAPSPPRLVPVPTAQVSPAVPDIGQDTEEQENVGSVGLSSSVLPPRRLLQHL